MSQRFHIHVHVADLAQSVQFYSKLFAAAPSKQESDYAKWMLDDPRINFAISTRGHKLGVDHLGFQVDEAAELGALRERAQSADMTLAVEDGDACCYARSDKHWITDPQGIAWEHFHTLADVPTFNGGVATEASTTAGCPPVAPRGKPIGVPAAAAKTGCC
jgi:catechol 2,3-dioxygenase-like lactoylglutathione lyase family enzyme